MDKDKKPVAPKTEPKSAPPTAAPRKKLTLNTTAFQKNYPVFLLIIF